MFLKYLRFTAIILVFILIASLSWHSLNSINQDIGRHLKTGEIIWQTKNVPKTNLFSFTEPDRPFINHHWLSEVIFYGLNNLIGLKGLIVFKVLVILASFSFIFLAVKKRASLWPTLIAMFLASFLFTDRIDVRPEIFSYLFLSFFIYALFQLKYEKNYKLLYVLPLVQILWTNTHIYFILGPGLVFLMLLDAWVTRSKSDIKKLAYVLLGTIAVTLINPNFIKGAVAPFTILKNYGYSIVENQSVFFIKDYGILTKEINFFIALFILLIVSFFITLKNGRKKILFEALVTMVFSILAFKMIRNFGLYSMIFVPIFALNLSSLSVPKSFSLKKFKIGFYLFFIFLLIYSIYNITNNNFFNYIKSSKRFSLSIPTGAGQGVEFIKQNNIHGPVFNNFDVGSFLIWKLYPEQKVFIDGRPEAYSVDFFEKVYKPMQENPQTWRMYSEKYKINYVFFDYHDITPWSQKFLDNISINPSWPLVYLDNSIVIFLKKTPENADIISKYHR